MTQTRRVCWEKASDLQEQFLFRVVELFLTCYQLYLLNYSPHFIKDFLISAFMPFSRHSLHVWQKMSHARAAGLLIPFLFSFSVAYIFAAFYLEIMFQKACDKAPHKRLFSFSVGEGALDEELAKQEEKSRMRSYFETVNGFWCSALESI